MLDIAFTICAEDGSRGKAALQNPELEKKQVPIRYMFHVSRVSKRACCDNAYKLM